MQKIVQRQHCHREVRFIIFALLAIAAPALAWGTLDTTPTEQAASLAAVIEAVKANEAKLSLLTMQFETDLVREGILNLPQPLSALGAGGELPDRHTTVRWAQDGIRQHITREQVTDGREDSPRREIIVVDGEVYRSADWPEFERGVIREMAAYSIANWVSNYASILFYRPFARRAEDPLLSETLASAQLLSDISTDWLDDREVLILDIAEGHNPEKFYHRMYLDKERGFLLRADMYEVQPNGQQPKLVSRKEVAGVHQTENGAWVPLEVWHGLYVDDYAATYHTVVDANSVSTDRANIPESLFHLEFPEHTKVTERIVYEAPAEPRPRSILGKPLGDLAVFGLELDRDALEGKPVVVCFFDRQQRPSRNAVVTLDAMLATLADDGFVVVGVQAVKTDRSTLDQWLKDNDVQIPVGLVAANESGTRAAWGIKSLPWLILTDREHTVNTEGLSVGELAELVRGKGLD